jgi:hypothetical protein
VSLRRRRIISEPSRPAARTNVSRDAADLADTDSGAPACMGNPALRSVGLAAERLLSRGAETRSELRVRGAFCSSSKAGVVPGRPVRCCFHSKGVVPAAGSMTPAWRPSRKSQRRGEDPLRRPHSRRTSAPLVSGEMKLRLLLSAEVEHLAAARSDRPRTSSTTSTDSETPSRPRILGQSAPQDDASACSSSSKQPRQP